MIIYKYSINPFLRTIAKITYTFELLMCIGYYYSFCIYAGMTFSEAFPKVLYSSWVAIFYDIMLLLPYALAFLAEMRQYSLIKDKMIAYNPIDKSFIYKNACKSIKFNMIDIDRFIIFRGGSDFDQYYKIILNNKSEINYTSFLYKTDELRETIMKNVANVENKYWLDQGKIDDDYFTE